MECTYDNVVLNGKSLKIEAKHNRPISDIFNILARDWQRHVIMFSIPFAIIFIVWNLFALDDIHLVISAPILITLMNIIDNIRVHFRNIEIPLDKISSIDIDKNNIQIKYLNLIRYIEYDKQASTELADQLKNIKPNSKALREQTRKIYMFALGVGVVGLCLSFYLLISTPIQTASFVAMAIYFTVMIAFSLWKILQR